MAAAVEKIKGAIETCRNDGSHEAIEFFEDLLVEVEKLVERKKSSYSPVEQAAIDWWRSYAEEDWDDEKHAEKPYTGLPYRFDFLLADAVMELLDITPKT